uniref:CD276 antigen-like n=1 Tax=Paramormyrops kingsleyae TaxID=1676925 RepID=A0A3B3QU55_9TELE|nr:CD276 antigen-like [Paramormyrops kingsleyae]XP_023687931.1 CD276 antigen-like [Paramormyrops kingsleyae]
MFYRKKYLNASLCLLIGLAGAFKVNTSIHALGVYGLPAVFGCTYSPTTGTALNDLIINWQRVRDSAVVHSFYSGRDQLSLQSPDYQGRTSLFHSELLSGNASLRLDRVSLSDEGHYFCSVSSNQGSNRAEVKLNFTALYTEPKLSIQILGRKVNFSYESRGYPQPEVLWTDAKGRKIPNTEVSFSRVEHGLFSMHACLTVDCCHELNYTFTLKNQPLGQVIQRNVAFRNGAAEYLKDCPYQYWIRIAFAIVHGVIAPCYAL